MIDIFISLCLVFALFSGLVSGINELIAQMLEMRGKVLYEGIALLLGELPDDIKLKRWIGHAEKSINKKSPSPTITYRLFSNPLIDTLSQPGSKPSYIVPSNFATALVQVLSSDGSWASLRQSLEDRSKPLGQLFGPMLDQANGDMDKFKSQVEFQFTLVMDRVGGWYKRRTQSVMFIVAITLAILLNVDTIYIAKKLQSNPELIAQLVTTAEAATKAVIPPPNKTGIPEKTIVNTEIAATKSDEIKVLESKITELKQQITTFQKMSFPIGWDLPKKDAPDNIFIRAIGWFLTALAATLGAPFWFDAISKFFIVRGAGKKPEVSSAITETSSTTPTVQVMVPPATPSSQSDSSPLNDYEASRLNGEDIEGLQRALGLPATQINGKFSTELRTALREWQRVTARVVDGRFDEPTVLAILYPES